MEAKMGTLTRIIAIDALTHVLTRKIHADKALERLFEYHKTLRPLDRAFIFEMVYGSLRWLLKMDWIMQHMMDRPFNSLDPKVANALRIGTYQIYYMDKVPARAAVSETVEAIKYMGIAKASSFINAILRRIAKKGEYFPKPDKIKNIVEYYSMHYSHPKWMLERWEQGLTQDRLKYLCEGNNTQAEFSLKLINRNNVQKIDIQTYLLKEHGIESSWRPLKGTLRIKKLPKLDQCKAFNDGLYMVQDESAQLVTSIVKPKINDVILDACAAPGSKSVYLWDEGINEQNLYVCDNVNKRIDLLKQNFMRLKMPNVNIIKGDANEIASNLIFDKILLDAPCSGTGVIRRHPEIKWLKTLNDIKKNAEDQKKLLYSLSKHLKIGGELIYIVCSIEKEEGNEQITNFLNNNLNFKIQNIEDRIHDYYKKYLTKQQELYILPGNNDAIDGFYAVVLLKV